MVSFVLFLLFLVYLVFMVEIFYDLFGCRPASELFKV